MTRGQSVTQPLSILPIDGVTINQRTSGACGPYRLLLRLKHCSSSRFVRFDQTE